MRRTARGARPGLPREQIESRFGSILADLVARVPGARAAALVDSLGETVDYAGRLDAFSVRVAAAHLRLVLQEVSDRGGFGRPTSISVRTTRAAFTVYALPEGYAVALVLSHRARLTGQVRPISAMARLLAEEVGWTSALVPAWYAVDVLSDPVGHPRALQVGGTSQPLDALGRYETGIGWRQRGWRVRFASGVEAMLVREPGGYWYADETPTAPEAPPDKKRH
jgi:hypothetical protein